MVIMVVDSDRMALNRAAKLLSNLNAAVAVVLFEAALPAIQYTMNHPVDLVYNRAKLSDLSGSELLQKILRYQPLAEGRILQKNEEILGSPLNSDLV